MDQRQYTAREVRTLIAVGRELAGRVDRDWASLQLEKLDADALTRSPADVAAELLEAAPDKFLTDAAGGGRGGTSRWDRVREKVKAEREGSGDAPSLDERLRRGAL